ncbi:MAG: hypothetical protein JL50_03720 [Peptococcaceae bacterium BICA1-7]|nr:MAG: hypothetical protein JL50_03720 [Peptococcaceae bacterium BICA1-7]HBV97625.1 hypothetical protein [Desulfotomaculum sp.]
MDQPEDNLVISVEKLVNKMEKMYERQLTENDKMEKMMDSLDSLSRVMARVESEKKYEDELNRKLEYLNDSLQRVMDTQVELSKTREEEKMLDKIIQGARVFGQVLSAVATGIQFSVENVGMVLKKDDEGKKVLKTGVEQPQADLTALLQPLNSLVKNFVDEKKKNEQNNDSGNMGQ